MKNTGLNRESISKIAALALLACGSATTQAAEVVNNPNFGLDIFGRGQMLGAAEWLSQDARDHGRIFLYLQQARLGFKGHLADYNYYTELALGGEDVTSSSGIALTLLEMRFDIPLADGKFIRIGEYKVPYGREFLSDDGALQFAHRSINSLAFFLGRDVGVAAVARGERLSATIGVYTGGSRDIPERYLPEDLGVPLFAARIGYDSTTENALANRQAGNFGVTQDEGAVYLSAAYMEDSLIGHSTVLNLRPVDRNLLINPNWNPYLAPKPYAKTKLFEAALDSVARWPVGDYVLSGEVELNAGVASNGYGTVRMYGGRLQGSAAKKPLEAALRYAVLLPDEGFAAGSTTKFAPGSGPVAITPSGAPIHELSSSLSYYLRDWSKLILQLSVQANVPVIHEAGLGSYVSTEQPDQTTSTITASGASSNVTGWISREIVPEAQLMWQISF